MMNEEGRSKQPSNRSSTPVAYKINIQDENTTQGTIVEARPMNPPPQPPTTPITATATAAGRVTNKTILAYNLGKSVKLFSILDGIFCFLYALYSVWYFVPLIMNVVGYYGAKHYNKRLVCSYLIYSVLNITSKLITWALITFYIPPSDNFDWSGYTFFSMVGILIELYICHMVYRLYKTLKSLSEQEYIGLQGLKYRVARIIYW